jgi:hypothetical protein
METLVCTLEMQEPCEHKVPQYDAEEARSNHIASMALKQENKNNA